MVLLNYLLPRDVIKAIEREKVTGLTAVPPLYIQLTQLAWPESITEHLRYFANTGGRMPRETLAALRRHLPKTKPFLMYGLTEAFRSTYLPPAEVDRRPDSIGKAIPNAEILVLREDGSPCAPNEPGELVHRGALVGMGYWNDPEKTAERYKPLPVNAPGREAGLVLPEIAVFSGDTVRMDEEGYPLLHRPPRRNDEDFRLPRQPDRSRGNSLRDQTGRRMRRLWRRPRYSGSGNSGHCHATRRERNRYRRLARRMPHAHAGLHGAGWDRGSRWPAAAQPQRQNRSKNAVDRVGREKRCA